MRKSCYQRKSSNSVVNDALYLHSGASYLPHPTVVTTVHGLAAGYRPHLRGILVHYLETKFFKQYIKAYLIPKKTDNFLWISLPKKKKKKSFPFTVKTKCT